jgi:hypothetical protein
MALANSRVVAKFPNTVALAGTFGAPDAGTGRGTASLIVTGSATTTYHFAYYIVSGDQLLLVQTIQHPIHRRNIPTQHRLASHVVGTLGE